MFLTRAGRVGLIEKITMEQDEREEMHRRTRAMGAQHSREKEQTLQRPRGRCLQRTAGSWGGERKRETADEGSERQGAGFKLE